MFKFNNIEETTLGLSVKNIKKSILAPVETRLLRKTAGDGSFDFGSFLGNKVIEVTFQDKTHLTKKALYNNMLLIAAWLYPLDKLEKKLEILDGPNNMGEDGRYYYAKVDGSTDLEEILSYGLFTVTFIASDPYARIADQDNATQFRFSRNSTAYNGVTQAAINIPRYQAAGLNYGLFMEAGTTNLIGADNFETGVNSWLGNAHTVSSSVDYAYIGTHSLKSVLTNTGGATYLSYAIAPLITDYFTFSVQIYALAGNVGKTMQLAIRFTGGAHGTIYVRANFVLVAGWQLLKVSSVMDYADRTAIGSFIYPTTGFIITDVFYSDCTQLEKLSYNTSFIDTARLADNLNYNLGPAFKLGTIFELGITIYPNWSNTDPQANFFRYVLQLFGDINNHFEIVWNNSTKSWYVQTMIAGVVINGTVGAQVHAAGNQLKLFIIKTAAGFTLYYKNGAAATINSGFVVDARSPAILSNLTIGSDNSTLYLLNAIVKDFFYNDTNLTPLPADYGM